MKKQLSVLNLMIRCSIWKVLLVFAAMAVSQVGLFFVVGAGEEPYLLNALTRIPSSAVVMLALGFLFVSLAIPLTDRGGRMNNLILRLGLPEKQIFWLQVLVNGVTYWLFLLAQGLIMVLLCYIHDWITPGEMDPMAVFVTSYQYPLFHRFFPLHDLAEWANHLILVAGLSVCTAAYPMRQRHRFNSLSSAVMLVFALIHYTSQDMGSHLETSKLVLPFTVTLCVLAVCLYGILSMEVDDDGKT